MNPSYVLFNQEVEAWIPIKIDNQSEFIHICSSTVLILSKTNRNSILILLDLYLYPLSFQFNVTPTQVRNEKKRNEDREPTMVDLKPFSGKAIVTFDDIPVSKTARRLIIVFNAFDEELKVSLSKTPKSEYNVALEWSINKIPPQSQINLEVVWTPLKVVSCRELIQISDEHGNKKDIALILKSREIKKTTARKIGPMGFPKKLKLKTPSPPRSFSSSTSVTTKKIVNTFREYQEQVLVSPLRNTTNFRRQSNDECLDRISFATCTTLFVDKENNAPATPNASTLFDNIRFTPRTESKPKNESTLAYLSTLPTPDMPKRTDVVHTETVTRRNLMLGLTPSPINRNNHQPIPKIHVYNESTSKTFVQNDDEINEIELVLNDQPSMWSKTQIISSARLTSISETEQLEFQKTFAINKSQSFTEIVTVDSPTRIISESMREIFADEREENVKKLRFNQGSMPNLNEMNESVGCIEQNRYYKQHQVERQNLSIESVVSTTDFRETEICAQSSRLNLNELGLPSNPLFPPQIAVSPIQTMMLKNIRREEELVERNDENTYKSLPIVLRRIQHDPEFIRPQENKAQAMIFSPPARNKLSADIQEMQRRETFDISSKGRNIRATTWKQQQNLQLFAVPKVPIRESNLKASTQSLHSLSSSSIASMNSTCSTPATLTNGRLYNENIMNAYVKKDPFSATTTIDPFLSSSLYLDEKTLDNIEKTYKKWLNALVTIPPDLETDKNEKIDVGKLFNEVQTKELTLAPTKETVCSRYYTARLDSLRNLAVQFFHSNTISGPLNKLTVVINDKNKLDIKAEANVHLNLVLQRSLIELLLCYNPLWLRIGLEVVFNVQLNLNSNHDIFGMTRFIITNMFKSQYLAEKYSKFSQQKEYLDKLRKHTVKMFLFLIFFLDRAKEHRLIKQNPCLFVKKAPYKETAEILKKFASLVLANYGDIIRTLRRFDVVFTHKQTVIDEFDYAFKNLAVDLRDGVRLTKVMEIILMRDDLVKDVRVPAISRLQKVFNVKLALQALEAADYQILGNITPKDIADGHREKTLSLLWQIIYKFRAPKFNAAALTIQNFWRSKYLIVVINRRIKAKEEARLNQAATVIQKYYRGWKSRQHIVQYRQFITTSTITIQKHIRRFITRRRYQLKIKSVVTIQQWFRQVLVVKKVRSDFMLKKRSAVVLQKWWKRQLLAKKLEASSIVIETIKKEARLRYESALIIQRILKSHCIHKKLQGIVSGIVNFNRKMNRKNIAAVKIQSLFRMKKQRSKYLALKQSTIQIQRWWRHKCDGKKQLQSYIEIKESTLKIQHWFRGALLMKKERKEFVIYRQIVVRIQQNRRATIQMRRQRTEYLQIRVATIKIQQRFRALRLMRNQKAEYCLIKHAAITIQNRFRAILQMRTERQEFLKLKTSAIVIQRTLRATFLMKKEREKYLQLKSAALLLQIRYRARLMMRFESQSYQILRQATISIQRRFRAKLEMKKDRKNFESIKQAAIAIQQRFRATRQMKADREHYQKLKKVTIRLQQKFRSTKIMRKLTVKFYSIQYYTTVIQQIFRAKLAMIKVRNEFLILKKTTIVIQTRFRAKLSMRQEHTHYRNMKISSIKIQRKWRATLQMRKTREEFLRIKQATLNIQRRFRANKMCLKERASFLCLKNAVKNVEDRYLAQREMKMVREEFSVKKQSAIVIQQRLRATFMMKQEVQTYKHTRESIIKIQKSFRGYQSMKVERERFILIRETVVTVQRQFRAKLAMKRETQSYQQLKSAAIAIQQKFRGNQAMKVQRNEYTRLRHATILIQTRLQATLTMRAQLKKYNEIKSSAIFIQQLWRSTVEMRKNRKTYQNLKQTAIKIQRRFRATKLMKVQRDKFLEQKQAAVTIQSTFRSYLVMKAERQSFVSLKAAAVTIQNRFRANRAMKAERRSYLRTKEAATKVQSFWRGFKLMRTEVDNFQHLKTAAIAIQRRFRANLAMKKDRADFVAKQVAAVKIQRIWRATIKMHKQKAEFKRTVGLITSIQRRFRANQLMKVVRKEFASKRLAALVIQRWFRGYQQMVQERNRFLLLKKSVLLVENRILGNRMMEMQREKYHELRQSVVYIQRRYRTKLETRKLQQQFKEIQVTVVGLQTRARGYQARQRFVEMQTPEKLELRKRHKAARTVQAAWRGYKERSKKCNRCFKAIVSRLIKASKNVNPEKTLAAKLQTSIDFLKQSYDSNHAISFLAKLEYMSRTVPWILIDDAEFVSVFCYGMMAQAIRSEVDKQTIELCSCIILNLSRYKDTKENAFQEFGLMTIAQMLLRWCDKDCGIFNTLCTLVWVFAHCDQKKQLIRNFIMDKDGEYIVSQIKQNVLRKENMRKNSRRPIGFQSISLIKYKKDYQLQLRHQPKSNVYSSGFITPEMLQQCHEMPSINPDYGVVKTMPYIFYSSVFAFDNVLQMLNIRQP